MSKENGLKGVICPHWVMLEFLLMYLKIPWLNDTPHVGVRGLQGAGEEGHGVQMWILANSIVVGLMIKAEGVSEKCEDPRTNQGRKKSYIYLSRRLILRVPCHSCRTLDIATFRSLDFSATSTSRPSQFTPTATFSNAQPPSVYPHRPALSQHIGYRMNGNDDNRMMKSD